MASPKAMACIWLPRIGQPSGKVANAVTTSQIDQDARTCSRCITAVMRMLARQMPMIFSEGAKGMRQSKKLAILAAVAMGVQFGSHVEAHDADRVDFNGRKFIDLS